MEATLQKLKVTELKELLAKNHLVQTGKKDELVKRLLDNNVHVGDEPEPEQEAELVDPDVEEAQSAAPEPTGTSTSAPAETTTASSAADTAPGVAAPTEESTLTPEQQALKARAERFGIPFNPNPPPKSSDRKSAKSAGASTEKKMASEASTPATTTAAAGKTDGKPKEKAGAIDTKPLGLSEEVLARRAAKFGLPEKKEASVATAPSPAAKPATTPSAKKEAPKEEISPELAARIAAEEEKKRKRAEKFGTATAAPATNGENGSAEPDAKKAKV